MQWIVLNVLGALSWLAGLFMAKGASLPSAGTLIAGDHQFVFGLAFGLLGLALMLWGNFRSPA